LAIEKKVFMHAKARQQTAIMHIMSQAASSTVLGLALVLAACSEHKKEKITTPWGEVTDSIPANSNFDLEQIVANGELIMLTLSGPETYYDYHGRALGQQYLLCQRFADKIGVSLRVELCRDTAELVRRLAHGDGDVVAVPLHKKQLAMPQDSIGKLKFCDDKGDSTDVSWVVSGDKPQLAEAIEEWYKPAIAAEVAKEERFLLSSRSVRRRVYAPMLNRKGGIISRYDHLFMAYCRPIRWDWRLMAAQCYQESTFDPQAKSWAGACGLMQIMPSTAKMLGLPMTQIHNPESNIAAAAKFLGDLEGKFSDIASRNERTNFVLASYNGGYHHIRDAMALAQKHGGDPKRWTDVSRYVLLLSSPEYYRDPVVKYGYMRGSETVDYVQKIRQRWQSYSGVRSPQGISSGLTPHKAVKRKKKYSI
jgi:membrane-bound lytic murein transglycosylase F